MQVGGKISASGSPFFTACGVLSDIEDEASLVPTYLQQEWRKSVAKIASLHGTTPAEIFQSGLENFSAIEAVALSVLWEDGSITAGWSNIDDVAKLALMILTLDERQRRLLPQQVEP